jgi:hypothetical protein
MANVVMRNRVTGEYRKVEKDGEEFWGLRAELHTDGRPRWEQTGEHDLAAFANRMAAGQPRAEDIGDQDQPVELVVDAGQASTVGLDRGWPTPGEIEQNAGRAADMSEDDLASAARLYGGGPVEGYPAGHPPTIDQDEAEEAGVTLGAGLSGSAGGPPEDKVGRLEEAQGDALENQPVPEDPTIPGNTAPSGDGGNGGDSSPKAEAGGEKTSDYTRWSSGDLRAEIERRNATRDQDGRITVSKSARKAALVSALKKDDENNQE